MGLILSETLQKSISFLKSHLKKNKFFVKVGENEITKFSGAKRGNKVYAHLTEQKIKPIIESLTKSNNAKFITLTHRYEYKDPSESWFYFKRELPKFIRKSKINSYLYVYEAHKNGGCHCHLIVNGEVSNNKIKKLWDGHVKIKRIKSAKIGTYLTKEVGKAGHVETSLKHADKGTLTDSDVKKIWRFFYLLKLKMRGWGYSRNLKTSESLTSESATSESATGDLISYMNNSTDHKTKENEIVISLPKKIIKNPNFRPYNERINDKLSDYKLITDYLASLKILIGSRLSLEAQKGKPTRLSQRALGA